MDFSVEDLQKAEGFQDRKEKEGPADSSESLSKKLPPDAGQGRWAKRDHH
jgi:hypothetical protein